MTTHTVRTACATTHETTPSSGIAAVRVLDVMRVNTHATYMASATSILSCVPPAD